MYRFILPRAILIRLGYAVTIRSCALQPFVNLLTVTRQLCLLDDLSFDGLLIKLVFDLTRHTPPK